jgi:hypothetical protein
MTGFLNSLLSKNKKLKVLLVKSLTQALQDGVQTLVPLEDVQTLVPHLKLLLKKPTRIQPQKRAKNQQRYKDINTFFTLKAKKRNIEEKSSEDEKKTEKVIPIVKVRVSWK